MVVVCFWDRSGECGGLVTAKCLCAGLLCQRKDRLRIRKGDLCLAWVDVDVDLIVGYRDKQTNKRIGARWDVSGVALHDRFCDDVVGDRAIVDKDMDIVAVAVGELAV